MGRTVKSASSRRSARVHARIPVTISGTLPDGKHFTEETHVLTLSKFGARLKVHHPLKVGMQVRLKPKRSEETSLFRVVWMGREGSPQQSEAGVEYVEVSNLFGINFPG
jgi:hypothetical protein